MEAPEKPSANDVAAAVDISRPYASMILKDDGRIPPRSLAIAIYRACQWRHRSIVDLPEEAMTTFELHDPWIPPKQRQDEAA